MSKENSWVVTYNSMEDSNNSLDFEYLNITGKSAKNAIEKHFNVKVRRLFGDEGRNAEIIVIRGHYDKSFNAIIFCGNQTCFSREGIK